MPSLSENPPVVRNLRFDLRDVPRYWHGGRRALSLFLNNLSIFFPAGERFFITSVRAHRDYVKDDKLAAAIQAFCAQEGFHSREHVRYNEMLRAQGFPVEAMERRVVRLLRRVARVLPPRGQLATTCALEHFTATLAYLLLSDPRLLEGAHPTMAALWRWHAVEESEHRAVAFDVYRAAGGGYLERVSIMLLVTLVFWGRVLAQQVRMMHHDGLLFHGGEWAQLFRFLFTAPGGMQRLFPLYLPYFRPSFHPEELDCEALVTAWQRGLQTVQSGPSGPSAPAPTDVSASATLPGPA